MCIGSTVTIHSPTRARGGGGGSGGMRPRENFDKKWCDLVQSGRSKVCY